MASNTATGALSRTRGSAGDAWCSGTCCIWARSTTPRNWRGGGRSRCSRKEPRNRGRCRCFRKTAAPGCWRTRSPGVTRRDPGIVHVKLSQLQLRRPRQRGACRLALLLWQELQLDRFWSKRLGVSRKGTRWDQVLLVLVANRLLAPGSEWRLHREWFQRSALADLLGEDAGPSTSSGGRDPQAVPLSRPAASAQTGGVRSPDGAVARTVQHQLRRAAVRSDEHPGLRRGRLVWGSFCQAFFLRVSRAWRLSAEGRLGLILVCVLLVLTVLCSELEGRSSSRRLRSASRSARQGS